MLTPFDIKCSYVYYARVNVNPAPPQADPGNSDRESVYLADSPHFH